MLAVLATAALVCVASAWVAARIAAHRTFRRAHVIDTENRAKFAYVRPNPLTLIGPKRVADTKDSR